MVGHKDPKWTTMIFGLVVLQSFTNYFKAQSLKPKQKFLNWLDALKIKTILQIPFFKQLCSVYLPPTRFQSRTI